MLKKTGSAPITPVTKNDEKGIVTCSKCGKVYLAARGFCPACEKQ